MARGTAAPGTAGYRGANPRGTAARNPRGTAAPRNPRGTAARIRGVPRRESAGYRGAYPAFSPSIRRMSCAILMASELAKQARSSFLSTLSSMV